MNMRKIIAVLAAVLMLCSIIPMGVFAAPGDVIISKNFDDGSYFTNGSNENGYMVFNATTADWANVYMYANNIKSGTKYEITFDCKANKAANINVKINNNWKGDTFKYTTNVTTEWATYTCVINPDELATLTSTALLMFTSNTTAANGAIYHIDNVVVKEYTDPDTLGKVTNGDFETGDKTGWSGSATVVADGYNSSYAAQMDNPGQWASALTQTVPVEANTVYEITWMSKRVSGSGAFNLIVCQSASPYTNFTKVAGQNWMNETSGNWVANTFTINTGDNTSMLLKFTTEATNPGVILLDNIVVSKVKDPSFDGYITNGDFETGKKTPWDTYTGTTVTADAAKDGDYGMFLTGGGAGYGGIANQNFTVEVGKTYVVRFDMKVVNAGVNVQVKNGGANVKGGYISKNEWTTYSYEFTATATNSNLNFCGSGIAGTDQAYLDNVMVYEKVEQSNDGYIVNGTFDTGVLSPWNNLWNSCTTEIIVGGKDSTFALSIISGEWKHVRQTGIAVEANTDYKITFWSKNVKNMNLLVKDNADTTNIVNKGIANSQDWAKSEITFNSGANTAILVSFMGGAAEAYGTFDTVVMEKLHTCNVVEQNRVDADCENDGYIEYACDCGLGAYTETIPATGHAYAESDRVDATCEADGSVTYTCGNCGNSYTETITSAGHSYEDEYDVDCNACGAIRVTDSEVVTSFGGNSVSEDVSGLAFKFNIEANIAIGFERISEIDYANSYIGGYKLVVMGAVASNNGSATILSNVGDGQGNVIDIPANWLCNLVEGSASFAVRITDIPENHYDTIITARPYYVYEDAEGTQITIYGEEQAASYNG